MTPDSLTTTTDPIAELIRLLQRLDIGRVNVLLAVIALADENGVYNDGNHKLATVCGLNPANVGPHLTYLHTQKVLEYETSRGNRPGVVRLMLNKTAPERQEGEGDDA